MFELWRWTMLQLVFAKSVTWQEKGIESVVAERLNCYLGYVAFAAVLFSKECCHEKTSSASLLKSCYLDCFYWYVVAQG